MLLQRLLKELLYYVEVMGLLKVFHIHFYHLCGFKLCYLCNLQAFELVTDQAIDGVCERVYGSDLDFQCYLLNLSSFWSSTINSYFSSFFDFIIEVLLLNCLPDLICQLLYNLHNDLTLPPLNFLWVNTQLIQLPLDQVKQVSLLFSKSH